MLERVFVYGSLQHPAVLRCLLKRSVSSQPATLFGYGICAVAGASYPAVRRDAGSKVHGRLLAGITRTELERLDAYEGGLYARRAARTIARREGLAWVYVAHGFAQVRLRPGAWAPSAMWEALDHPFKVQRYLRRNLL